MLLQEAKNYLDSKPNTQEARSKLTHYLNTQSLSKTPERYKILEKITLERKPFTINAIHKEASKEMCMALMTVNRAFKLFIKANIIKKVNEGSEMFTTDYFELI